jgi:ActR/RegA family two-component response regulator
MREVNPSCVAIVLTAYPDVRSAVEGIRLNIDDYMTKPANADELVANLAEKLAARAAESVDPDERRDSIRSPSTRIH